MPLKRVIERARKDMRQGKSPSSAAGEFVREEMHHIREGKHGAKSAKQAVAIGLSEARRAGIPVADKRAGRTSKGSSRKRSAASRSAAARKAARTRARNRSSSRAR